MTSRVLVTADIMDVLNESEESDQEYSSSYVRLPCRDFEIELSNLVKKLSSDNMINNNPNRSGKRSVLVQTDPDTSDIPASWLLACESLVGELYTGLGNFVNTVYHSPLNCSKGDAMRKARLNPAGMKYFTFENGYWQSTLLPSIKIPDLVATDKQYRALFSEDTKRSLLHLVDVASKLKSTIAHLGHCASCENPQFYDGKIPSPESPVELRRSHSPGEDIENSHHIMCDMNIDTSLDDSEESSAGSPEFCNVRKPVTTKRVRKDSFQEVSNKKHVLVGGYQPTGEIRGVKVLRYSLASRVSTDAHKSKLPQVLPKEDVNAEDSQNASRQTSYLETRLCSEVLSSCSNDSKLATKGNRCVGARRATERTSGEKSSLYDPEKSRKLHGNRQKNFIRKNIMDLKKKAKPLI